MSKLDLGSLTYSEKTELLRLLEERSRRTKRRKLYSLYPETGKCRRELYSKFVEFFAAGATNRERAIIAANRVGKSFGVGGYETTLHLTGLYPDWWVGKRFNGPVDAWAAGDTGETTRDIIQVILTGIGGEREGGEIGTGLIPGDCIIGSPSRKMQPTGAFDTITVRHASGGVSKLGFKAYDQGRKKFQGTSKHLIWLDEEPPADVYTECLTRTMDCNGIVLCTFTPLSGISDVVLKYMPHLRPGEPDGI